MCKKYLNVKIIILFCMLFLTCKQDKNTDHYLLDFYSDPVYLSNNDLLFTVRSMLKRYLVKYERQNDKYTIMKKEIENILYPQYSYEHKKITFTGTFNDESYSEIFIMDENGENLVQLTSHQVYSRSSFFIPGSNNIIYKKYDNRINRFKFYIIDIDGKNETIFFDKSFASTSSLALSLDGNLIAFTDIILNNKNKEKIGNLVILDINNKSIKTILENIRVATPQFLDNETIIYSGYAGDYLNDYKGLFKLNIKTNELQLFYDAICDGNSLDISSDKDKLLYSDYICDFYEYDIENKTSKKINIDSNKIYDLINNSSVPDVNIN